MAMAPADPREARFLASQAERLSHHRRPPGGSAPVGGEDVPELTGEDGADGRDHEAGDAEGRNAGKEAAHRFWKNFRAACSEFQRQIDEVLLLPPSSSAGDGDDASPNRGSNDDVKAHYATAARRNEGRAALDALQGGVRRLRRHVLSSSSSSALPSSKNVGNNDVSEVLQSILACPMPEVTQTEVRLLSQEVDAMLKRIDDVRGIVCPKEKFVFRRYRRAMAERERAGGAVGAASAEMAEVTDEEAGAGEGTGSEGTRDNLRSQYGGVLENMSDCTVEVAPDGTVLVDRTSEEQLRHCSAPLPTQPQTSAGASSYLLQHLQNVTLILRGSRPSIHMQHIRNCQIYVAEPTLGPVHVTDCHTSELRCSCYQLRVHESTDVHFGVWVRSGPIIEDCHGMVFAGDYFADGEGDDGVGKNMYRDVKDFNWLRALRKSPNFAVVERPSVANKEEVPANAEGARAATSCAESTAATVPVEEDSEDEL